MLFLAVSTIKRTHSAKYSGIADFPKKERIFLDFSGLREGKLSQEAPSSSSLFYSFFFSSKGGFRDLVGLARFFSVF